jgi:TonB family protein
MIEILFVKSSIILGAAAMVSLLMRGRSAAARHLVWLCSLCALLIVPVGLWLPKAVVPIPNFAITLAESSALPAQASSGTSKLFVIWLCGVVFLLARLAFDFVRVKRVIGDAEPAPSQGPYPVAVTSDLAGPVAWGIGGKRLLLPDTALGWDAERLQVVLLHESGHLRRHDCWALLISEIACALYWCNPLVWFAAAQLRREQEHAADDEVLNGGVSATAYAGHLVAIARTVRAPRLAAGAFGASDLAARIQAILDQRRNRAMVSRNMILAGIVALLAITLPVASMQAGRKIYRVSDEGVIAPRVIDKREPTYTQEAKEAKIQGRVKLSAVLDIDGKAHDVKVEEGIDDGLDANAVAAVQTWRFEPAQKAGEPVPVAVQFEINFRLLD